TVRSRHTSRGPTRHGPPPTLRERGPPVTDPPAGPPADRSPVANLSPVTPPELGSPGDNSPAATSHLRINASSADRPVAGLRPLRVPRAACPLVTNLSPGTHADIRTSYAEASLRPNSRYQASMTSGRLTASRRKISLANATGSVGPAVMRSPSVTASVST